MGGIPKQYQIFSTEAWFFAANSSLFVDLYTLYQLKKNSHSLYPNYLVPWQTVRFAWKAESLFSTYAAKAQNCSVGDRVPSIFFFIWPFLSIATSSIPASCLSTEWKFLKPSIGRVIRFTPRWSECRITCSTTLLRYLHWRIFRRRLLALLNWFTPALLAPRLSILIKPDLPFLPMTLLKNVEPLWCRA